ncbi:DUF3306 domain-containing protein [Rhodoferax sp. UBA5149]|uniref:DUF3306 domain-containing protein n=1 Tax=Rhodoferax sp. UBA5149 TaxID=1947379 RepID=UPI0025D092FD|nr:DUF3306 domain-containing protein [Rhodoferax sp. UBA5149]
MAEGFLGRWSQRKQAVREGKVLDEPAATPAIKPLPVIAPPQEAKADAPPATPVTPVPAPPPPSLEDVRRLTTESDFKPFVARDVAPEVRNAAMKKLFADPHYNVMDRLDTYIDDYSKPDPLPESMLRQMASAKFLNLFEDEEDGAEKDQAKTGARDDANSPAQDSVAQSAQPPRSGADPLSDNKPPAPLGTDHDHTDLRLQPNHAAGPRQPGRGTE